MTRGWFVGNFQPSVLETDKFEVGILSHPSGQEWPAHYHKVAQEINYLVSGDMTVNDVKISVGDIFVIEPGEVAKPVFLQDCQVLCIKVPSVPGDKYLV